MILLDTDHITILRYPENPRCARLASRLGAATDTVAVPVISVEEQLRGWLAEISRHRDAAAQMAAYQTLAELFHFFAPWQIVPLDAAAVGEFNRLRKQKVRLATMDLKIAAIALAQNALLLSANLRDFQQVPGLRVENWLEPEVTDTPIP
jgi:tRNA(fMet)-specific endonuclease VapC